MVLDGPGRPLRLAELPVPAARPRRVADPRARVRRLPHRPAHPRRRGGRGAAPARARPPDRRHRRAAAAQRVGVPWLGWTCGECRYCRGGRENLCDRARFTGCDRDGGFAEYAVADDRFCFPIPDGYPDLQAAPLLCAGLIGHRALRMTGDAERLGPLRLRCGGAHRLPGRPPRAAGACSRSRARATRRRGGSRSSWAPSGRATRTARRRRSSTRRSCSRPVGALVPAALRALAKGGTVVCAGIHMSDIPSFPYADLWGERSIRSVANLTRRDGEEFLALAPQVPVRTRVAPYPLERAGAGAGGPAVGAAAGRRGRAGRVTARASQPDPTSPRHDQPGTQGRHRRRAHDPPAQERTGSASGAEPRAATVQQHG